MIGFVILGLILVPLFTLMVIAVLEPPRMLKVPAMFTAVFLLLVVSVIGGFLIFGWMLGFIVN